MPGSQRARAIASDQLKRRHRSQKNRLRHELLRQRLQQVVRGHKRAPFGVRGLFTDILVLGQTAKTLLPLREILHPARTVPSHNNALAAASMRACREATKRINLSLRREHPERHSKSGNPRHARIHSPPEASSSFCSAQTSRQGPLYPTLRANLFCRLPLPTLLYRPEVTNLGDLMRLWVRPGV